ncbi:MAG: hypothetical protein O7B26_03870, partial [Planctomycetota bacterium]|nr:hypothetical protein [Planctomycetota bacterium]
WRKGHDNKERTHRVQAGMPYHPANAFYYELVKSAIISNFNPNTRISRYNSNLAAFIPVDKSDLVAVDEQDGLTPRAGYTTEFCFDTMGVYEITTLGEIAKRAGPVDAGYRRGVEATFEPLYRKKQLTVVKVFGVIRHTNQFHFEQTFQGAPGGRSSRKDRKYVVTWPDPMIALTDVVSQGSTRDGRIELAGRKDGDRAQMGSYTNIVQSFRSPETIIMAWSGQDRDDSSYAQLRRLALTGSASQDYNRRVQDIWDADYNKSTSLLQRHYSRETLVSTIGGLMALNFDVRAETEGFGTHLRPDGIHNSIINSDHLGVAVLHLPAHGVIGQGKPGRVGTGSQVGAGIETNVNGNVPYYNGGIAFWVKFDFDAFDPVFSGLIGCTQIIEDVPQSPQNYDGSEGTQFFIFKNTKGMLRVVRMYYHEAFPSTGGEGAEASVSQLRPTLSDLVSEAGGKEQVQGYLDPRKPIARADLIIDIRHFRAHEWHHIAVDWNDSNPGEVLRIFVDFERVQGGGPFIPQELISDLPTAWVRLNHRRPIDGLFIGGFLRHQGASDAGIFKWYTNTFSDSQGRVIRPIEKAVKRILANATIDELITYTGTFQSVKRYFVTSGSPGYFTNQTGVYANVMRVPLPPEVDHIVMRSFDWTSYYPSFFWGNFTTRTPDRLRVNPILCSILLGRDNPQPFNEVWQRPNIRNPVAGKPVLRSLGGKGLKGRNAELVYEFRIPPAIQTTGAMGGGSVATPIIDDVTATYFLPNPRILYQEEVD